MDKTKIKDLKEKIFLRSALIAVDSLEDIFALNEKYSGDKLLGAMFEKALRKFEFYYPLVYESRVNLSQLPQNPKNGYREIVGNFKLYHQDPPAIAEDQIILVPNAIPKIRLSSSMPYPGTYMLPVDYQRPYIHLGNIVDTGEFWIRGICSRPIFLEYLPDGEFKDSSAVYFMNIDEGVLGQAYLDQCIVEIFDYVRSLKANLMLPNFSVDIFGAVDNAYQQIKSELDNFYLQSSWRGELLV